MTAREPIMKNKNLFIFASLFWVQVKPKTETKAMAKTIKQKHYRPTDQRTDGPSDQRTDTRSYRVASS